MKEPLTKKDGTRMKPLRFPTLKTIRNEMVEVISFFKWAEKRGYVRDNPGRRVDLPKIEKAPPRYLKYEEFTRLKGVVDDEHYRDIIDFYVLTGVRRAEGIALKPSEHLDLERRLLTVPQSKQKDFKLLPISDELLPVIFRLLEYAKGRDRFIQYNEDTLTNKFRIYAKAAGLSERMTFHVLRHTFGTWLANNGANFSQIQALMGHRDPDSTKKYVHFYEADLSPVIGQLKLPKQEK